MPHINNYVVGDRPMFSDWEQWQESKNTMLKGKLAIIATLKEKFVIRTFSYKHHTHYK